MEKSTIIFYKNNCNTGNIQVIVGSNENMMQSCTCFTEYSTKL